MTAKLQVQHLTKIFGRRIQKAEELLKQGKSKAEILQNAGATVGVSDANFEVNDGEIFVIMGLSGSGKSTMIRMINRLIEPTSGKVMIDGENLTDLNKKELLDVRRNKMSMVFQNFALFPNRTIIENTAYGLEVKGVDKDERLKGPRCLGISWSSRLRRPISNPALWWDAATSRLSQSIGN